MFCITTCYNYLFSCFTFNESIINYDTDTDAYTDQEYNTWNWSISNDRLTQNLIASDKY